MTKEALKFISDSMDELNLNYEFMEWTSSPNYPYFVGEYQENEPISEDGLQETAFILNGFSRTTWQSLESAKAAIENYFDKIVGKTAITSSGNGLAVFYANSLVVRDDSDIKRIQINLKIKEWKVN